RANRARPPPPRARASPSFRSALGPQAWSFMAELMPASSRKMSPTTRPNLPVRDGSVGGASSEDGGDEGRQRGALGARHQSPEPRHHRHDRTEPPLLPLAHQRPQLGHEQALRWSVLRHGVLALRSSDDTTPALPAPSAPASSSATTALPAGVQWPSMGK